MEKTTVYLTSEQKAALSRAALEEGRSEAWLIRAGIEAVMARHASGESAPVLETDPREKLVTPSRGRPRWIDRESFVALVLRHQADTALRSELRGLAPDTTDEPLP